MLDFLTLKPESFGLEISESYLRIIKLNKKGLASWAEQELEPGIISGGDLKKEKEFSDNLANLLKNVKGESLKTNYVIVSLPEERAFLQTIILPEMEKDFLEKAVYYEVENYIPLKIEEACLDFEVISKKEVLVAAYPKKVVLPFFSCLKKQGLIVKALEIESQSIVRALIKEKGDFLIIDAQKEKIVVLVYSKGAIRFTSTLEEKSLIPEIEKCFVFFQNKKPRIILNRADFLKDKLVSLGFSVELANPWVNFDSFKKIPELDFQESLNYSVAIGLALRAVKKYD
ncbi:MAG: pilus assembly protein PilM [Candidatus Pacebacteria bacterium]|nr:pilus assembly protein PilM [Candidatus Paceibacterota bacterium]